MEKILIAGPSWVGDMVMAQSLFIMLKQRFPDARIDVLAPAWSKPILDRMPEVNDSIILPTGHGEFRFKDRWQLGKSLRQTQYTRTLVLPRSWKSALVTYAANIPQRTGFHGEQRFVLLNDRRKLDKKTLNQTVKRFFALGLEKVAYDTALNGQGNHLDNLPDPALDVNQDNQQILIEKFGFDREKPGIALMPGAEYGPAKQWPLESFRSLAEQLVEKGYQVWILGSPKEAAAGDTIAASGHQDIHNLCGKTSLSDAVDLLALAEQAVSNDSGLMHVAAAAGTFVHGIYGSSSAEFTPPLTEKKQIHSLNLECSPCFKRHCPLKHTDCLNKLSVDSVLQGVEAH